MIFNTTFPSHEARSARDVGVHVVREALTVDAREVGLARRRSPHTASRRPIATTRARARTRSIDDE